MQFVRLVRQLPRTSRTVRAAVGIESRWGDTEHLLAGIFDAVNIGNWLFAQSRSKRTLPKPAPLPRPGQKDPKRRLGGKKSYPREQMQRMLARMRPKKEVTDG